MKNTLIEIKIDSEKHITDFHYTILHSSVLVFHIKAIISDMGECESLNTLTEICAFPFWNKTFSWCNNNKNIILCDEYIFLYAKLRLIFTNPEVQNSAKGQQWELIFVNSYLSGRF